MKSFRWKLSEIKWSAKERKNVHEYSVTRMVHLSESFHTIGHALVICQIDLWQTSLHGASSMLQVLQTSISQLQICKNKSTFVDQAKRQNSKAGFSVCLWFVFWKRVAVVVCPIPKALMRFRRHKVDERKTFTILQTKEAQKKHPSTAVHTYAIRYQPLSHPSLPAEVDRRALPKECLLCFVCSG